MYIVSVLIEHPVQKLDMTFDYLSNEPILHGVRVRVAFGRQNCIGYVESCSETDETKEQLESKAGFKYSFIQSVIDEEPLLSKELHELALYMAKLTFSSRIACLQAMLPSQLKPATTNSTQIKTLKKVKVIGNHQSKTSKRQECLLYLKEHDDLFVKDIPYSKGILDGLVSEGLITYYEEEVYRTPLSLEKEKQTQPLKPQQQYIVDHIIESQKTVSLIHGVTGSGKTRIYIELTKQMLQQKKQVIMLVPEISLTPMMVNIFKAEFSSSVAILHSRLSQGERYDEYRRIKRQEVDIVVGARSAIFAPLDHIGLIILDEEHDSSYKQESQPRYYTHQIAKQRADYHHAKLVLGSATPSLESYTRAQKGIYDLYQMKARVHNNPLPTCHIVDMTREIKSKNYSMISRDLKLSMNQTLEKKEQIILLLNKRGYSSFVTCLDCQTVIKCPHCDVSLTYHKFDNELKCHYCDYRMKMPYRCPTCQQSSLKLVGSGTQKLEEELQLIFPQSRIQRFDNDTTAKKNEHQRILKDFEDHKIDILLGTQMIAKGLDFENVTLVGVLNADITLNIPDFRSSERTFQLITQVAGRSGRGDRTGTVYIQTYNPDHYAIVSSANQNYEEFYKKEMLYRQKLMYPPYCHLISLLIQSKDETLAHQTGLDIVHYLKQNGERIQVLGPAPSGIHKINYMYRERILIKFIDSKHVLSLLERVNDYYNRKNNGKVSVVCDLNPYTQI